tara:strand:- start:207 stop:596 length:390 start_codon:yes stop_codon:yes gene_type:complete
MNLRDTERMEVAKYVISKMWKCEAYEFTQMKKRNKNIVNARRFFIYYLWKYLGVSHLKMKNYIHGVNHATSIYHCRKLEQEVDLYKEIRKKFITFFYYADNREYIKMKIDIKFPLEVMEDLELKSNYLY